MNYLNTDSVIIFDGQAVKLRGSKYILEEPLKFNFDDGTLIEFKLKNKTYKYYNRSSFLEKDIRKGKHKSAYYEVESFHKYISGEIKYENLLNKAFWGFDRAVVGDIIEISMLDARAPFNNYYEIITYRFKIRLVSDLSELFSYLDSSKFPSIEEDIESDNFSIVIKSKANFNIDSLTYYLYTKNIANRINSDLWVNIPDTSAEDSFTFDGSKVSKRKFAKLMVYICWEIHWIKEHILDKLAINDINLIIDLKANSLQKINEQEFEQLPFIDKVIADLCHRWGIIRAVKGIKKEFNFQPLFEPIPDYEIMLYYFNSLRSLYNALKFKNENQIFPNVIFDPFVKNFREITIEEDSDRRLEYVMNLDGVPIHLFPYHVRIELFLNYFKKGSLSEAEQRLLIKLINSFNNTAESDMFLDIMLHSNGAVLNFEILYEKLDDARIERYPIINWFVKFQTNKKFFIYLLYQMWLNSKYNFLYEPPGATNVIEGVNYDGFFLNEGNKYIAKYDENGLKISGSESLMEFKTWTDEEYGKQIHKEIKYDTDPCLRNGEVIVNKRYTALNHAKSWDYYDYSYKEFGTYHLYQPIGIYGYNANLELRVPTTEPIPAFLLFYANEFDEIYDFDAGVKFGLEVVSEAALFVLFGGVGALRHLKHLRHLTKLRHIKVVGNSIQLVGIAAEDAVIVWRALDSTLETISVSAGILMSFYEYQAQIDNDQAKQDLYNKTAKVFMFMTLATGLASAFARSKASKLAEDIIFNTSPSTLGTLHADVTDVLNKLKNQLYNAKSNFGNNLQNIQISNSNEVYGFFHTTLSGKPELQNLFWKDFRDFIGKNNWDFFNNTNILDKWERLGVLDIAERMNKVILSDDNSVNAIIKYYNQPKYLNQPTLREILEPMDFKKRWKFLDDFGNQTEEWIEYLIKKPTAIRRLSSAPAQTIKLAKNDPQLWLYILDDFPLRTYYKPVGGNSIKYEFLNSLDGIIHFRGTRFGPPPRFNLEGLIKYKKLTLAQQEAIKNEAIYIFRQGTVRYSIPVMYKGKLIPISSYDNVLGMAPDFKGLGMAFDPPDSFNLGIMGNMSSVQIAKLENKLSEPISSIINKIKTFKDGVKVPIIEGTRTIDYRNMWIKMGINPKDGEYLKSKLKLEIHHLDDLDKELHTTLQIVTKEAHLVTKSHSGSVKLNEIYFDLINNLP